MFYRKQFCSEEDTDKNFFSGCPLFTHQSEVEGPNSRFIKDDTIFIKVIVDIQNIRHP